MSSFLANPAALDIRELTCRFGRRTVVDRACLRIEPGERVALVGGNGAGKTTLLRALLGLHAEVSGDLRLNGHAPGNWIEWRRRIAFIPQRLGRGGLPLRIDELIASAGAAHDSAIENAATRAGVEKLLDRPLSRLSGGELQRAWLGRAFACLAAGAGLLLADEPTAALDSAAREQIGAMLATVQVSALIATHDRMLAGRCDRIVEIAGGALREIAT